MFKVATDQQCFETLYISVMLTIYKIIYFYFKTIDFNSYCTLNEILFF